MKKLTQDPASVRNRLLNAAEQVAARDGVASLTLDAVAREAGVSKGGLLYHFPTKSDLINGVVERLATHCEQEQKRVVQETPLEPGAFTRAYLRCRSEPLDPQELPIHMALLAAAGTDSQFLDPWRSRIAGWQARLESDGIDPVTATIVRLAMDGICLSTLLGLPVPEGAMREKVLERLRSMTELPAGVENKATAAASK
jgi:AcrR family transcriptional regulator